MGVSDAEQRAPAQALFSAVVFAGSLLLERRVSAEEKLGHIRAL
jgi:hypothetical protein